MGEVGLATPKSVQKLQTALHAKAKAEAGYRFYNASRRKMIPLVSTALDARIYPAC